MVGGTASSNDRTGATGLAQSTAEITNKMRAQWDCKGARTEEVTRPAHTQNTKNIGGGERLY